MGHRKYSGISLPARCGVGAAADSGRERRGARQGRGGTGRSCEEACEEAGIVAGVEGRPDNARGAKFGVRAHAKKCLGTELSTTPAGTELLEKVLIPVAQELKLPIEVVIGGTLILGIKGFTVLG